MTFSSALFDSTQVCLEIHSELQTQAWQQSQTFATPGSQWNAYLNQLCLQTLLPYLREEAPQVNPSPHAALLWELVNGSAVTWANRRLVLMPTETIDLDEIRIPQEWVDIPNWVADDYLVVQVNPDHAWVRVAGFVTHAQLKQQATLDCNDRTYCLDSSDLMADLSVLWLSHQLSPEARRAEVGAIAPLTTPEASQLIRRLGDATVLVPRLAVPFERWAALLSHGGWRQRLIEQRFGLPEQRSPLQWLQSGISALAQQWSRIDYQPGLAAARGSEAAAPTAVLSQQLTLANQRYELQLMPIDLTPNVWRFVLSCLTPTGLIPAGVTLRLLTEDLQPFPGNEDVATVPVEQLYVEVALEPGEGLVWEVEPTPEGYEREILRF